MKQSEVYAALSSSGLTPTYGLYVGAITPPLLEYQFAYGDRRGADDEAYARSSTWFARLYTSFKDIATEEAVEAAISTIAQWDKTETPLEEEKVIQVTYTFETRN